MTGPGIRLFKKCLKVSKVVTTQVVRFTVQDKKVQRFKIKRFNGSAVQGLTVNTEP